jgi:hypothetical protein
MPSASVATFLPRESATVPLPFRFDRQNAGAPSPGVRGKSNRPVTYSSRIPIELPEDGGQLQTWPGKRSAPGTAFLWLVQSGFPSGSGGLGYRDLTHPERRPLPPEIPLTYFRISAANGARLGDWVDAALERQSSSISRSRRSRSTGHRGGIQKLFGQSAFVARLWVGFIAVLATVILIYLTSAHASGALRTAGTMPASRAPAWCGFMGMSHPRDARPWV